MAPKCSYVPNQASLAVAHLARPAQVNFIWMSASGWLHGRTSASPAALPPAHKPAHAVS
jgi:hypothetical protein